MTQTAWVDLVASTDTGSTLTTKLNALIPTLYTNHAGTSRPSYATAGMLWIDTTTATENKLYLYDGTQDQLIASFDPATANSIKIEADGVMLHPAADQALIDVAASTNKGLAVGTGGTENANILGDGSAMFAGLIEPKKGIKGRTDGVRPSGDEIGALTSTTGLFAKQTISNTHVVTGAALQLYRNNTGTFLPKGTFLITAQGSATLQTVNNGSNSIKAAALTITFGAAQQTVNLSTDVDTTNSLTNYLRASYVFYSDGATSVSDLSIRVNRSDSVVNYLLNSFTFGFEATRIA